MININDIIFKFNQYNIPTKLLDNYFEPHRYYHNIKHIFDMLNLAKSKDILTDELFLAIVFHDIIYDVKSSVNEENSANLLYDYVANIEIVKAILDTKTHNPSNMLSEQLCELDLYVLYGEFKDFMDYEDKIFKEYQYVDYKQYINERIKILKNLKVSDDRIEYVKNKKYNIGVYAGSFNPFHKGHYNILEKAEKIFDKVIIARGINPDKANDLITKRIPNIIKNKQFVQYTGLLTDFINSLNYDVTLIRGLRNSNDLQYESTQLRFLQELKPNIKMVSFLCDKEYEHISSSAIRNLMYFDKHHNYILD